MNYAELIDHTLLRPDTTAQQILQLCDEAVKYKFCSVCINPGWVKMAADYIEEKSFDYKPKVCTVVGFPLGANSTKIKVAETKQAVKDGATEIDMVMNIGLAKSGEWSGVQKDIKAVVRAANGVLVKVILETCLLSDKEISKACKIAEKAGVQFVKTSTGFSTGGATVEAVRLMRQTVSPAVKVKASGGVRTQEDADKMIAAGADRLGVGTPSGLKIIGVEVITPTQNAY